VTRGGVLVTGLVLLGLVLVQVTLVAFLPTPWAVPDLVVVAVLALGHAHGPRVGGLAGAWAGLLLDLVPPADGPLGGWMLVLALAGAVLGRVVAAGRPGPFASMVLLSAGAGLVVRARAAVLWFAGSPVGPGALGVAAATALYALVLAPAALLVVSRPRSPATTPVRTVPPEVVAP
jgi:rod shape-determining protein MreD